MKEDDYAIICKNIHEKKCILFIGAEFPIEILENTVIKETSFANLISNKIVIKLVDYQRENLRRIIGAQMLTDTLNCYKESLKEKDLSYLATECNRHFNRENIEVFLSEYLESISEFVSSSYFEKLTNLPFTFVVDTNYSRFFHDQFKKNKKYPKKGYYNFKGDQLEINNQSLGTEFEPYIYNLFGSIDETSSLVITESDLVHFLINVISKAPGLPATIKSKLSNKEYSFLFLGFGLMAKNWYFRILLAALGSGNKERISYAMECLEGIDNDQDPTFLFFQNQLKINLYYINQKAFINKLIDEYTKYRNKRIIANQEIAVPEDAPKTFISYKSEDFEKAYEIFLRLRGNGIDAWLDRERLNGTWKEQIANEICSSNSFILLQSQNLLSNPVNYVHVEIKKALEKAKYFNKADDFIFPTYIDSPDSILDNEELKKINSWDLTRLDKVDELSKELKRRYERNKKLKSA